MKAPFFPLGSTGNATGKPIQVANQRPLTEQLPLRPLMGGMDAPQWLPDDLIDGCATYRQVVRLSWVYRRIKGMSRRAFAEHLRERTDERIHDPHVSDWFNADDQPGRRDLPARLVADAEVVLGNRAITQWLNKRAQLTCMEEVIARRAA